MKIPEVGRYRFTLREVLDILERHVGAPDDCDLELNVRAGPAVSSTYVSATLKIKLPGGRRRRRSFRHNNLRAILQVYLERNLHSALGPTGVLAIDVEAPYLDVACMGDGDDVTHLDLWWPR